MDTDGDAVMLMDDECVMATLLRHPMPLVPLCRTLRQGRPLASFELPYILSGIYSPKVADLDDVAELIKTHSVFPLTIIEAEDILYDDFVEFFCVLASNTRGVEFESLRIDELTRDEAVRLRGVDCNVRDTSIDVESVDAEYESGVFFNNRFTVDVKFTFTVEVWGNDIVVDTSIDPVFEASSSLEVICYYYLENYGEMPTFSRTMESIWRFTSDPLNSDSLKWSLDGILESQFQTDFEIVPPKSKDYAQFCKPLLSLNKELSEFTLSLEHFSENCLDNNFSLKRDTLQCSMISSFIADLDLRIERTAHLLMFLDTGIQTLGEYGEFGMDCTYLADLIDHSYDHYNKLSMVRDSLSDYTLEQFPSVAVPN